MKILSNLNSVVPVLKLICCFQGVAFEQGKLLPTPETIPFRLTRDVVDGMGVFAIEGVFRRCCEKTLDVLKDSKEALITIVEVGAALKLLCGFVASCTFIRKISFFRQRYTLHFL